MKKMVSHMGFNSLAGSAAYYSILPLSAHSKFASAKGSLISTVRDACRKGLLDWSPRLMLAMYSCDIQASSMYLKFTTQSIVLMETNSRRTRKSIWCGSTEERKDHCRRNERRADFLYGLGTAASCGELRLCGWFVSYFKVWPHTILKVSYRNSQTDFGGSKSATNLQWLRDARSRSILGPDNRRRIRRPW